jgi:hypothetical protein
MALKGDRIVLETDITQTCESVASRGVVLCYSVAGSGAGLGDTAGKADLFASPSGKVPVGLLMNDVVSIDQTRYHKNFQKDETIIHERCTLLRKGRIVTDQVTGSPTAGSTAYLTTSGVLTPTVSSTGGLVATPKVGQFATSIDEDGYAAVNINLPVV